MPLSYELCQSTDSMIMYKVIVPLMIILYILQNDISYIVIVTATFTIFSTITVCHQLV